MAELAASIIGIVSAGTKVTLVLSQLAADVGSAAKEARMIGNEIRSFCAVVKTLGETLEKVQNSQYYAHCNDLVGDMTDASLEMFTEILNASESIRTMSRGKGGKFGVVGRVQWAVFKKPKITMLRTALEAYKSNLALMLGTLDTTEKVNRRLSLKITAEVIAEEEKDKESLQKLEDEYKASLTKVDRVSLLLSEDGVTDAGDDDSQTPEDAAETTPLIQDDADATPATGEPLTDTLLGSVRNELNSIRNRLSRFSTFSSDYLQDRVSRHSKTLSQLMADDQQRFSQRWSSILNSVWEDQPAPAQSDQDTQDKLNFQLPTLPDNTSTQPKPSNLGWLDADRTPLPQRPPSRRSPVPPSPGAQRQSILTDTFYDVVRTWLLEKPLEDRRVLLGTLMNDVCVATQKSPTLREPERLPQPRAPSPNPQPRRSPSPNPQLSTSTQKPYDPNGSVNALTQYRKKAREITGLVKEQFQKYTAEMEEKGYDAHIPLTDIPGLTIDLGHKKILKLPHEIVEVLKSTLERLSLSYNRLMDLPINISACSRLRYLNLRANNFVSIPEPVLELPELTILDMSRNMLSDLPQGLIRLSKTLKVLSVDKNKIHRLPNWLPYMEKLQIFKWEGNPLVYPPAQALELFTREPLPTGPYGAAWEESTRRLFKFLRPIEASQGSSQTSREVEQPKSKQSSRYPVKPSRAALDFLPLSDVPDTSTSANLNDAGFAFRPALPKRDTFELLRMEEPASSLSPRLIDIEQPQPVPAISHTVLDTLDDPLLLWDAASNRLLVDTTAEQDTTNQHVNPAEGSGPQTTQKLDHKTARSLAPPSPWSTPWSPPPPHSHWRSHSASTTPTGSANTDLGQDKSRLPRPRSFLGVPSSQKENAKRNSMGNMWSVVSYPDDV